MPKTEGAVCAYEPPLRPALATIDNSRAYMGGVSRASFYRNFLPQLETVRIGGRQFVIVDSMDRLIKAGKKAG